MNGTDPVYSLLSRERNPKTAERFLIGDDEVIHPRADG